MKALGQIEIQHKLKNLDLAWSVVGTVLMRSFAFNDFKSGLAFVNRVGHLAEEANHHPHITLSWGKVEVMLSTHSLGGLSNLDFELAHKIDSIH